MRSGLTVRRTSNGKATKGSYGVSHVRRWRGRLSAHRNNLRETGLLRVRQMTERFLWTIALGAVALLPAAAVAQTPTGSNVAPDGKQEVPAVTTNASGSGNPEF